MIFYQTDMDYNYDYEIIQSIESIVVLKLMIQLTVIK